MNLIEFNEAYESSNKFHPNSSMLLNVYWQFNVEHHEVRSNSRWPCMTSSGQDRIMPCGPVHAALTILRHQFELDDSGAGRSRGANLSCRVRLASVARDQL